MAAESTFPTAESQRIAVVTGANKGIGLETCRQLARNGVTVVLTARDVKRGLEAVENIKSSGHSYDHLVFFHQLDVTDPASIDSLADFIATRFGRLDILVDNAGHGGVLIDMHDFAKAIERFGGWPTDGGELKEIIVQSYEQAVECLETNYCGTKRASEALLPLLQLSTSPRIVNVSSLSGKLENIPGEAIKQVLHDIDKLTEDGVDEILGAFLKDFKEGRLDAGGWPGFLSAYKVSKAAMNAYTRILAKKLPSFLVNSVCPGYVKTDLSGHTGVLTTSEGAESPVRLALLPENGSSGFFFSMKEQTPF